VREAPLRWGVFYGIFRRIPPPSGTPFGKGRLRYNNIITFIL